jgi:hypothetical protein
MTMRLSRKVALGILLILALSSGVAAQQSRQSQKTPGVRPDETNTQAAEPTANDQQQNVRKPDVDKTNSPEAGVHIDPTSETFPQTMVGNTSDAKTVTLTYTGTTPLKMGAVATNNGEFPVPSSPCDSLIAAGGTCAIKVKFKPAAIGERKALLTIIDSDESTPQFVILSGSGTSPASLMPGSTTFDTEVNGATSSKKTITLTNHSASTITSMTVGVGGTNATDFQVLPSSTCSDSLEPGASCAYYVVFTPSERDAETGTLRVTDNGGTQTADLKGLGAGMKISGSLAFGTVANPATKILSVTVTNEGAMPVGIGSATIANSGDAAYGVVAYSAGPPTYSSCAKGVVMLAKGQTCTISVQFTPPAGSGTAYNATLNVYESDGKTPQAVAISGEN